MISESTPLDLARRTSSTLDVCFRQRLLLQSEDNLRPKRCAYPELMLPLSYIMLQLPDSPATQPQAHFQGLFLGRHLLRVQRSCWRSHH